MIPPVFRHIGIPTDQVRTAAPFGQEFQLPFVQHTVFVQISSRYRIGIDSVFEITLADCIDQIGSPLFVTGTHLAFGQHIIDLGQTDHRYVRIAFPLELFLSRTRTAFRHTYPGVFFCRRNRRR